MRYDLRIIFIMLILGLRCYSERNKVIIILRGDQRYN
jgi:hypothetical protein